MKDERTAVVCLIHRQNIIIIWSKLNYEWKI